MSMTKREFHEEIREMIDDRSEEEYFLSFNEKAVDWFSEERIAHDGFTERDADIQREIIDEDLPF